MGIFSRIFRRKKEELPQEDINQISEITAESANLDNIKAKIDLILTQIENLKIQYANLNEKIDRILKIIEESTK